MQEKRRKVHAAPKTSVEDEIAHLRGLDLKGLRSRWHSVFQRPPPDYLPRHLLFAIIAYRIQADRLGDLDHETKQVLDRTDTGVRMSTRLVSFDQKRTELTPGTVLVREWDRRSQRVMVMADGFGWNGQTYDSLSKVAFAITGTAFSSAGVRYSICCAIVFMSARSNTRTRSCPASSRRSWIAHCLMQSNRSLPTSGPTGPRCGMRATIF
jgi:hypothetical protein